MEQDNGKMLFETDGLNGIVFKYYKNKGDKEPFVEHRTGDIAKILEMRRMIDGYIKWYEFWIGQLDYYNNFNEKIIEIIDEQAVIRNTDADAKYSFSENLALFTEDSKIAGQSVIYDNDKASAETLAKFKEKYPNAAPINTIIDNDYVYMETDDRQTAINLYTFIYSNIIKPVLDAMLIGEIY